MAFAVEITLFFRGFAQGVEGFDAQQVFFAVDEAERRQRGVGGEGFDGDGGHGGRVSDGLRCFAEHQAV